MQEVHIPTQADLRTLAGRILSIVSQTNNATVLALSGELGAGKTAFVQALAVEIGIVEHVTSPTFVIMKRYAISRAQFRSLVHVDAYRVASATEMEPLGFVGILQDPENLICIEWPEHIADILPRDTLDVRFVHEQESGVRTVTYGYNRETDA